METIFEKPLDKQVAENTDHIATLANLPVMYHKSADVSVSLAANSSAIYDFSTLGLLPPDNSYSMFSITCPITGANSGQYCQTKLQGINGSIAGSAWGISVTNTYGASVSWTMRVHVWYVNSSRIVDWDH